MLLMLLAVVLGAGCATAGIHQRIQVLKVTSTPAAALVVEEVDGVRREVGRAPVEIRREYRVQVDGFGNE
jgi:hypothetical protein